MRRRSDDAEMRLGVRLRRHAPLHERVHRLAHPQEWQAAGGAKHVLSALQTAVIRVRASHAGRARATCYPPAMAKRNDAAREPDFIEIIGARQHNLRIDRLEIPKRKLVVFTGVSGSGKSSLAFDTLYAEGQRRYVETLSAYARQFLGQLERPRVDHLRGLSPTIAIEQKSASGNPRSTVGTITEIYDYLRVLYAKVGEQCCPTCGKPVAARGPQAMSKELLALPEGTKLTLLAPLVTHR